MHVETLIDPNQKKAAAKASKDKLDAHYLSYQVCLNDLLMLVNLGFARVGACVFVFRTCGVWDHFSHTCCVYSCLVHPLINETHKICFRISSTRKIISFAKFIEMNLFRQRILTASNLSARSCLLIACPTPNYAMISFLGMNGNTKITPHNQTDFLKNAPADLTKVSKQLTQSSYLFSSCTNIHPRAQMPRTKRFD